MGLIVPAVNSGFDSQDTIVKLQEEAVATGEPVGLDINSGEVLKPQEAGIVDNFVVKKQIINSWYGLPSYFYFSLSFSLFPYY